MSRRLQQARAFNLAAPPLVRGNHKDERRPRLSARHISISLHGFRGVAVNPATARTGGAPNLRSFNRIELDRAASNIVAEYGSIILGDAIKLSANREDAEDAYQRALVVLLNKAPSTDPKHLVPWLRVVVRNEALEIARRKSRTELELTPIAFDAFESSEPLPEEIAEADNEIEIGFEALGRLTADQKRCMLAQADGLNYEEIAERTGFTRRKVSRCLERGRIAFAQKVDAIAAGSECARMEPLIHRVLEADADAALELRPHLRHCIACRTRMREYETAPRRVAALLPPALVLTDAEPEGVFAGLTAQWQGMLDAIAVRLLGAQQWVEVATAKKTAIAIVALAGVTAGGGVAVKEVSERVPDAPNEPRIVSPALPRPRATLLDEIHVPARPARPQKRRKPHKNVKPTTPAMPTSQPDADRSINTGGDVDDGSSEFAPESRSGR